MLGVNDFAFRRGQRYGTLLVDLERRRPVGCGRPLGTGAVANRQATTLARWLQAHPMVEIVTPIAR